jgi:hypothetical protein
MQHFNEVHEKGSSRHSFAGCLNKYVETAFFQADGRVRVKALPFPSVLSALMVPLCASTMVLT